MGGRFGLSHGPGSPRVLLSNAEQLREKLTYVVLGCVPAQMICLLKSRVRVDFEERHLCCFEACSKCECLINEWEQYKFMRSKPLQIWLFKEPSFKQRRKIPSLVKNSVCISGAQDGFFACAPGPGAV